MAKRTLTGNSPQREQQYQERMTLRIARRMDLAFQRELNKAMRAIGEAHGNPGAQAMARQEHNRRLANLLRREYNASFDLFGPRILKEAPKHHRLALETKAATDVFDRARQAWIEQMVALKVTEIGGTTEKQAIQIIREATQEAVREGIASQAALGKLIQARITEQGGVLSRARSRVIARTESHASANAATQEAAKATGLAMQKEWVSSSGARTRDDHRDADGQTVPLDMPFVVGGEELMYPGDPRGSAEQVINCRCASVHVVVD
jgi:hypothetical protein